MKILYYFMDRPGFMYGWHQVHWIDELKRAGHSVEIFNPLRFESIAEANDVLRSDVVDGKLNIDLFITSHDDTVLDISNLSLLKVKGIPSLLICWDNLHSPFRHKEIAPLFDLVWLTNKETKSLFEAWGCKNLITLPYAANPHIYKHQVFKGNNNVVFVGSPYGGRVRRINQLSGEGINVELYTNKNSQKQDTKPDSWRSLYYASNLIDNMKFSIGRSVLKGYLLHKILYPNQKLHLNEYLNINDAPSFSELQKIYGQSALSLNVTELRNTYLLKTPIYKLHLRTFEIPAFGGLQITNDCPEIRDYFLPDKEIILFRSTEEYVDKAKFYTNSCNARLVEQMKRRSRERCMKDHSWKCRFDAIFAKLSVK